jgi:hypothetical protein
MKQIFITVKNGRETYDKNMMDSNSEERTNWYNTLSKVQIANVLEQFVTYEIKKDSHS